MRGVRLLAYCDGCGHAWFPDKPRGKLQCSECGSRKILVAAPDAVLDHVREKAGKEKAERVRGGVCPVCGVKPGCVCRWCGAGFSSYRARIKHVRDEHPEKVKQPGGQRKDGAQGLSGGADTAAEKERVEGRAEEGPRENVASKPAGRGKSKDTEQPIHKRLGIKAAKLERIVADFERAENRSGLDEDGRPLISEEHNVEWVHLVGKVEWRTAHKIFHEVLMPDAGCTLPVGYKRME